MKALTVKHLEAFELKLAELEVQYHQPDKSFDLSWFPAIEQFSDVDSPEFKSLLDEFYKKHSAERAAINGDLLDAMYSLKQAIAEAHKQIDLAKHVDCALNLIALQ